MLGQHPGLDPGRSHAGTSCSPCGHRSDRVQRADGMQSVGRALARAAKRHCSVPPSSSCASRSGRLHRCRPPASCSYCAHSAMAIALKRGRLHSMHACRCDGGRRGHAEMTARTHEPFIGSAGGPASPELRCQGNQVRGGMPSIDPRRRGETRRCGASHAGAEGDAHPHRRLPPGPTHLSVACPAANASSWLKSCPGFR